MQVSFNSDRIMFAIVHTDVDRKRSLEACIPPR